MWNKNFQELILNIALNKVCNNEDEIKKYIRKKQIENSTKNGLYKIIWNYNIIEWKNTYEIELIEYKDSWVIKSNLKSVKKK